MKYIETNVHENSTQFTKFKLYWPRKDCGNEKVLLLISRIDTCLFAI